MLSVQTDLQRLYAIRDKVRADRKANEDAAERRGITINQFYQEREHYQHRVFILKRVWLRSMQERPDLTDAILQRMKSTHAYYLDKLRGHA
jgi:hypothetical protein